MSELEVARHNQIKGVWGWVFVGVWIAVWWWVLNSAHDSALARPCPDSLGNKIGDFFTGEGQTCRNDIDGKFTLGLVFAFLTSPIGFVIGHHFSKWQAVQMVEAQQRETAENDRRRRTEHEAALAQMSQQSRIEQQANRQSGDRFEIITRLGAVDDQLAVLENETNPENTKLIKLNIGQSIRDIHAKFKDDELRALYHADEGLRQRVDRTLAEMRRLNLQQSRHYHDLAGLFAAADAAE